MKIALNEKQYNLLLSNLPDDQEISEDESVPSTPTSSPTSSSTTSTPTSNVDAKGVSSSGEKVGYPTVSKWSDVVGSKLTRGPGNQIANTKWSDIVGSLISRGASNQLSEAYGGIKKYQNFSIEGPYQKTKTGQIASLKNVQLKTNETITILYYIKNETNDLLIIENFYGNTNFGYKGGKNISFTKQPLKPNQKGILTYDILARHTGPLSVSIFETYTQTITTKNNKPQVNILPYVMMEMPTTQTTSIDDHTWNMIFGIAALFIPVVGLVVAGGIGLYDAYQYHKEGDNKTAGLVALFSLLPGIGPVLSRIPGVKYLGKEGMILLAKKLSKNGAKAVLNTTEKEVLIGIKTNEQLVKTEVNNTVKVMAQKASLSSKISPKVKQKLIKISKNGLILGGYVAADEVYGKIYDYFSNTEKKQIDSGEVPQQLLDVADLLNKIATKNESDLINKLNPIVDIYAKKYDPENMEKLFKIQIAIYNEYLRNPNQDFNKIADNADKN